MTTTWHSVCPELRAWWWTTGGAALNSVTIKGATVERMSCFNIVLGDQHHRRSYLGPSQQGGCKEGTGAPFYFQVAKEIWHGSQYALCLSQRHH